MSTVVQGDGFLLPLCSTPLLTQGQHLSVLDVSENAITCSGAALLAATLEACGGSGLCAACSSHVNKRRLISLHQLSVGLSVSSQHCSLFLAKAVCSTYRVTPW